MAKLGGQRKERNRLLLPRKLPTAAHYFVEFEAEDVESLG